MGQFEKVINAAPAATFSVIIVLLLIVVWMTLKNGFSGFSRSEKLSIGNPLSKDKEQELKEIIDDIHASQGM
jgi:hypothetical protein